MTIYDSYYYNIFIIFFHEEYHEMNEDGEKSS